MSRTRSTVRAASGVLLALSLVATGAAGAATASAASPDGVRTVVEDEAVRDFVVVSGDGFNGGTDFLPTAQIRTMGGSNYLTVRVLNTDPETLTIVASSVYGEVTRQVAPGASSYVAFPMRTTDVPLTRLSVAGWVEDAAGEMVRGSSANLVNVVLPQG
ncbi:hypothetical protein [Isoptericola sp. NPDC056605]|uniref:hypothetical protein n=1 Tax=Isoptericola sp. NPDC056605 TaxID=3345876 RepID=UPI00368E2124